MNVLITQFMFLSTQIKTHKQELCLWIYSQFQSNIVESYFLTVKIIKCHKHRKQIMIMK